MFAVRFVFNDECVMFRLVYYLYLNRLKKKKVNFIHAKMVCWAPVTVVQQKQPTAMPYVISTIPIMNSQVGVPQIIQQQPQQIPIQVVHSIPQAACQPQQQLVSVMTPQYVSKTVPVHQKIDEKDERYLANVTQIGDSPTLTIPGKGTFHFAYRSVKKRPGEPRTLIAVGNIVECRLTQSNPPKAISIRIISGTGIPLAKEKARKAEQQLQRQALSSPAVSVAAASSDVSSLSRSQTPESCEEDVDLSWVDNLLQG